VDPPNHFNTPAAMPSAATFSRNVTKPVDANDFCVFRKIRPRIPGLSSAIRCSFSRHALDLPVPAGPASRTSSPRVPEQVDGRATRVVVVADSRPNGHRGSHVRSAVGSIPPPTV